MGIFASPSGRARKRGKKIVILGGGIGGVVAANRLREQLPSHHEILLVNRRATHFFHPSLLKVMTGTRSPSDIQRPLLRLERKGIQFFRGGIQSIDFERRTVWVESHELRFDMLVIALGASIFPKKIPGFTEGAHNLYHLPGVEKLRHALPAFPGGKLVVLMTDPFCKCPTAPYEAALMLSSLFKRARKEVEIEVATSGTFPVELTGREGEERILSLLHKHQIQFRPGYRVQTIDPKAQEITFQCGKSLHYDLLIGVPPHGLPQILEETPLRGEHGWVKVNSRTLETEIENIYAVGDVTAIPLVNGGFLPKLGVFAHFQAEVVAHRIAAKLKGEKTDRTFNGRGSCFIELGNGQASYLHGNFYARPEPRIHVASPSYLWQLGKNFFEKWWFWRYFR